MNVFDFDHTLYDGDSTIDFWRYCLRHQPRALAAIPHQLKCYAAFSVGRIDRDSFKEGFYCFLGLLSQPTQTVDAFWRKHMRKINRHILKIAQPGDVVISASPEFLLKKPCNTFGLNLIASKVDIRNGALRGANCRGSEKVRQFKEMLPDTEISAFYSDSLSDAPMASIAKRSFLVKKGEIREWPFS